MTPYVEWTIEGTPQRLEMEEALSIGRDRASSIPLDDPRASRTHAAIHRLNVDHYYVLDVGSRNGVLLNGNRLTRPTRLRDGDEITVGDTVIRFVDENEVIDETTPVEKTSSTTTIGLNLADLRWVTVLVADIRGFTSLSETIDLEDLSRLMSDWFHGVRTTIERYDGRVDKFTGDGVMALWDGPELRDSVQQCLRAALALQELTRKLGEDDPRVERQLGVGVGINSGMVAVGIGGDHSAIGDDVNVAFRLESASKELGYNILLSRAAYEVLPPDVWEGRQHRVRIKGKKNLLDVCGFAYEDLSFLA